MFSLITRAAGTRTQSTEYRLTHPLVSCYHKKKHILDGQSTQSEYVVVKILEYA